MSTEIQFQNHQEMIDGILVAAKLAGYNISVKERKKKKLVEDKSTYGIQVRTTYKITNNEKNIVFNVYAMDDILKHVTFKNTSIFKTNYLSSWRDRYQSAGEGSSLEDENHEEVFQKIFKFLLK